MRVKWIETFCDFGESTRNLFDANSIKVEYEGEVILKYTSLFHVPKFAVKLDDGSIVKVRMDMCHTIDEEIDKIKDYLDAIIKDCDKLNSANVSHNAPYIKAVAQNLLEIFKNR
mgnify:FL=1